MAQDLTAILMPAPPRGLIPDNVVNLVAQNVPPTAWVRLSPLEKLDIQQLEVLDGQSGLPAVSPSILVALSQNGGKAMFVHVNHQGKQALLHAFEDGIEVASYTGEPGDAFDAEVTRLVGHSIDDVVAEDDGTRIGFGQAATRTAALVRGRLLMVPPGTPTGLGSFVFHDRGFDTPSNLIIAGDAEADTTRAAFFAFDGNLIHQAFNQVPGSQLAQVLGGAPQDVLGPLIELRDPTVRALTPQQVPPGQAKDHPAWHTHTFERYGWRGIDPGSDPNDVRKWTELRSADVLDVSVRAQYDLHELIRQHLTVIVDLFNVFDLSSATRTNTALASTYQPAFEARNSASYGAVLSRQVPFRAQFGLRYQY